jgi:hypothetical protein
VWYYPFHFLGYHTYAIHGMFMNEFKETGAIWHCPCELTNRCEDPNCRITGEEVCALIHPFPNPPSSMFHAPCCATQQRRACNRLWPLQVLRTAASISACCAVSVLRDTAIACIGLPARTKCLLLNARWFSSLVSRLAQHACVASAQCASVVSVCICVLFVLHAFGLLVSHTGTVCIRASPVQVLDALEYPSGLSKWWDLGILFLMTIIFRTAFFIMLKLREAASK